MIVYYRMCGIPSTSEPPIYKDNKFKLNKYCLESFIKAYRDIKPEMIFINDYCSPKYNNLINSIVPFKYQIVDTAMGINETCLYQYKLYDNAQNDTVLFQECDYYHLKPLTESIIRQLEVVSPYDHPDKYPDEISSIQIVDNHHFKHTKSTTATFACTRAYFEKHRQTLDKHGYIDHERWIEMGGLYSPIPAFATHMLKDFLSPSINWNEKWSKLY